MEWCNDTVLDPNVEQDSHRSQRTKCHAGSVVCRLLTDSNVGVKVDRLALSAHKVNL
jgi:hypothetical protein